MYNGTNTDPSANNSISPYEIVAIISAVLSGLTALAGAFQCYRQKSRVAEKHISEAIICVKGTDAHGNHKEISCSVRFSSDEIDSTSKTKPIKQQEPIKKQAIVDIKEEGKGSDDNWKDPTNLFLAEEAREDVELGTENQNLINSTLSEFRTSLKLVFSTFAPEEVITTGEVIH